MAEKRREKWKKREARRGELREKRDDVAVGGDRATRPRWKRRRTDAGEKETRTKLRTADNEEPSWIRPHQRFDGWFIASYLQVMRGKYNRPGLRSSSDEGDAGEDVPSELFRRVWRGLTADERLFHDSRSFDGFSLNSPRTSDSETYVCQSFRLGNCLRGEMLRTFAESYFFSYSFNNSILVSINQQSSV